MKLHHESPGHQLSSRSPHLNNFDLLRLLAALSVVYIHGLAHLHITQSGVARAFTDVVRYFPGVPIFFVISGFLVSMSYERSPSLRQYARNRALRIYPALWVCFLVTIALLASVGVLTRPVLTSRAFVAWIPAQLTFGQFFNLPGLRHFGVGVVNGSLWTIPVELAFYAALPLLYRFLIRPLSKFRSNVILGLMALASYGAWFALNQDPDLALPQPLLARLVGVTLLPHLWMFILGLAAHRNSEVVLPLVRNRLFPITVAYIGLMTVANHVLPPRGPVSLALTLAGRVGLAAWTLSFAYSFPNLSSRVLRGHDISYGVYIYHMPLINLLVHFGLIGAAFLMPTFIVTIALATASWRLVEAPALNRKRAARPPAVRSERLPNAETVQKTVSP